MGVRGFWGCVEQEVGVLLASSVRIFRSPAPLERHRGAVRLDPRWTLVPLCRCFLESPAVAQTLPGRSWPEANIEDVICISCSLLSSGIGNQELFPMFGEAWDQDQDLRYTLPLHWLIFLLFSRSEFMLLTLWLGCT